MKMRVISFCRVSTEEQANEDRAGLARQREDIRVAVERHGLEVVRFIELIGVSGTMTLEAPEFQDMLLDLSRSDIDGVVCSSTDRLGRADSLGEMAVFDPFYKHGKRIWTREQVIDVRDDSGFLHAGFSALIAAYERKLLLRRIHTAKEEQRKRGRHPNSANTLPRGVAFDQKTGKWSYVEPHASAIKRAFELLLEGRSIRSIAKEIGGWSDRGLRLTLANPIWLGGSRRYTHKRGEKYPGKDGRQTDRRKVQREQPLEVPIDLEPLIDATLFYKAQELLEQSSNGWRRARASGSRFELSGYVWCDVCGQRFYSKSYTGRRHPIYHCKSQTDGAVGCRNPKIRMVDAHESVVQALSTVLTQPEVMRQALMRTISTPRNDDGGAFAKAEVEIERLKEQRQRLLSSAVKGLFSADEIKKELMRIDAEMKPWQVVVSEKRSSGIAPGIDPAIVAENLASVFCELDLLSQEQREEFLAKHLGRVYVADRGVSKVQVRVPVTTLRNHRDRGSSPPPS